jgi:hypothetical protein
MGQVSLDYGESANGFQTMNLKLSATALSTDASESSVIKDWLLANDQAPRHEELITLGLATDKDITMDAQAGGVIIEPVTATPPTTNFFMGGVAKNADPPTNQLQISMTCPTVLIFDPAAQPDIHLYSQGGGTVRLLWI